MITAGIIDMGTNTFHLLIADVSDRGFAITHRYRQAVKVGAGGINQGLITEAGAQRVLETLQHFRELLTLHDVTKVKAIATSAFRNAVNGSTVADHLAKETGIPIQIISGEEEAELIYRGITSGLDLGDHVSLIVDIGGGSVECILGDQHTVFWKQSFEIGGQRLLEKFQKHDPMLEEEGLALYEYLNEQLQPLKVALEKYHPEVLIGSSGSFDTLSEMYCARESLAYQADDAETPLTIEGFYHSFQELKKRNRAERLELLGMIELRVDMIVVACFIIDWLFQNYPEFYHLRVSTYSLKEGALSKLFPSA
jgi:exopolyphosphatase/guanosine-5'-triphosphate,3'-diphosphate pyrophosphatase